MRFGRRQVVDADVRIYVQEVRAVHTAAANGGMRVAVRLPGMRQACPPCPPDRTRLPHHVCRSAPGRRKVRAHHRRIARPAAILARSCWMDQEVETCPEAETCPGESVSASLTDLASRDPAKFPSNRPDFLRQVHGARCGAHAPAGTSGRRPLRGWRWCTVKGELGGRLIFSRNTALASSRLQLGKPAGEVLGVGRDVKR